MSKESREQKLELYHALLAKEKINCEKSYYYFFKSAWKEVLETETPLIDNWHIHYLCWLLQREVERIGRGEPKTKDIIINVPPRSLKTSICTMYLQPWAWIHFPHLKFLTASYDDGLSAEHAVKTRRLIKSPWYQMLWGDIYQMTGDQALKTAFENNRQGHRMATSVGGAATGKGGDIIICDDPHSAKQAASEAHRATAIEWWEQTMFSRLNDPAIGLRVIVMQRLHQEDLTGNELSKRKDKYLHICLPAKASDNIKPPRLVEFYEKDLMFPGRFNNEYLSEALGTLGAYGHAGQFQQRPSPEAGGMFKRRNWKYWQFKGDNRIPPKIRIDREIIELPVVELPDMFDEIINSWDMTFKDTEGTDHVAGHTWARKDADKFLLDRINKRMSFSESVNGVKDLKEKTGFVTAILIEEKANGPAVINQLSREIAGIIPIKANDSKQSRALPMSRQQESGNIFLPHPDIMPEIDEFTDQYADFPKGRLDDDVDAGDQAINFLSEPDHQVMGAYRWNDPRHRADFDFVKDVKFSKFTVNLGAMVQQEDLSLAHLFAAWDPVSGRLWVYNELKMAHAIAAMAVMEVRDMMSQNMKGLERFIADPAMFSKRPTERTIVKQYQKYGLRPRKPIRYDENGAIAITLQMFTMGRITIHKRCQETDRQLREWIIANGRPQNKNVGLCVALCLIVSELERKYGIFSETQEGRSYKKDFYRPPQPAILKNKDSWQAM